MSRKDGKVCIWIGGAGRRKTVGTVTTWGSTTRKVLPLRDHLIAEKITCVVTQATGGWKPFYSLLEDRAGAQVMLVKARHVKALPGCKTDVSDATWLAQLLSRGGLFVPLHQSGNCGISHAPARRSSGNGAGKSVQRLEQLPEQSGIKPSAVATEIVGVPGG